MGHGLQISKKGARKGNTAGQTKGIEPPGTNVTDTRVEQKDDTGITILFAAGLLTGESAGMLMTVCSGNVAMARENPTIWRAAAIAAGDRKARVAEASMAVVGAGRMDADPGVTQLVRQGRP